MNVLIHWLDDEFSSQHRCLAVKCVPQRHTVDLLAAQFNEVNQQWSLDVNNLHVVVSGAAIVKEAVSKVVYDFAL